MGHPGRYLSHSEVSPTSDPMLSEADVDSLDCCSACLTLVPHKFHPGLYLEWTEGHCTVTPLLLPTVAFLFLAEHSTEL